MWTYGKVDIINETGREIRKLVTWYKTRRMRRFRFAKYLTEDWINSEGSFWRREAGEAVGEIRRGLELAMDYDWFLRLGKRWPGRYIDRHLAHYRWHSSAKSGQGYAQQYRETLNIAREHAQGGYSWSLLCHRVNLVKNLTAYHVMSLPHRFRGGD